MDEFEVPDRMRDEMRRAWHEYLDRVTPLRPALHSYCRRLTRNLWEADDLVQDTLLRGFGQLARHHDPIRNPRAYLLRCATHLWIDAQRRRQRESELLAEAPPPDHPATQHPGELRDAAGALMQLLAPQERAAVILKDVFDMSLDETAEVLETTVGAIKSALHRGRKRLQEGRQEDSLARPRPARKVVERFVELFNANDRPGLLALVLDNAGVENSNIGIQWGAEQHRGKSSWFEGALGGHPEWPEVFRFESQRLECVDYEGEPIALHFRTRGGQEALEGVLRFEDFEGQVSHMHCYSFSPEVVREVGQAFEHPVRTGMYRYPTPEPGGSYRKDRA
jgi:RNA polymerase sigma-70 factor (ECF subfamily)